MVGALIAAIGVECLEESSPDLGHPLRFGQGERFVGRVAGELRDVGAGGEDPRTSGDHHGASPGLARERVVQAGRGRGELAEHLDRQGVDLAVLEGDGGDAVVGVAEVDELGHGRRI